LPSGQPTVIVGVQAVECVLATIPLVPVDVSVAVDIEVVEAVVAGDLIVLAVPVSAPLGNDTYFFTRQAAVVVPVVGIEGARIAAPLGARDHAVVVGVHPP